MVRDLAATHIKIGKFDFEKLSETSEVVTFNCNRVIDRNFYPLEEARRYAIEFEMYEIYNAFPCIANFIFLEIMMYMKIGDRTFHSKHLHTFTIKELYCILT